MGIDFLNVKFHLEKEFDVELEIDDLWSIVESRDPIEHSSCWGLSYSPNDIRFHEIIDWVNHSFEKSAKQPCNDAFQRSAKVVSNALGVDEDELTPNALMIRDLGLD